MGTEIEARAGKAVVNGLVRALSNGQTGEYDEYEKTPMSPTNKPGTPSVAQERCFFLHK